MTGRALPGPAPKGLGLWWVRASRTDLLGLLRRLQQAHGPLCVTRVLNMQVADVFDPALARTLLVEHAAALQRWPRLPEVLARYHGPSSLLVVEEAAAWQPVHDALVPAFAPRALEGLPEVIATLAAAAVEGALAQAKASAEGGVEVDRLFTRLTIQVVERWLFGANRWTEAEVADVAAAIRTLGGLALRELFIPWAWLRRLPSPANRARRAGLHVLNALLLPRLGEAALLQDLPLVARADNLRTMFAAGHDTTAQALAWWCALMAHHPAALQSAQAELDSALAGRPPTAADLPRLPWLAASLKEALRLYPAVPVLAMRCLRSPVVLGDWTLPAGTLVRIAPWMLHRDAQAWPQPEAFLPERFLPEAPTPVRGAWLPFGAGPRACIGRPLALLEMTTVAAVLLQRCTPRPLPGAAMPLPELDLVLRPRQGLRLVLAPRLQTQLPEADDVKAAQHRSLPETSTSEETP